MHIFLGPPCYHFPDSHGSPWEPPPSIPRHSSLIVPPPGFKEEAIAFDTGSGLSPSMKWEVARDGGWAGWCYSHITEAMSDGGVYERTLTVQAQMGGWRLKGNVIAVSKHLENNHRKWKQDLLGERPGVQSSSCWVEVGVQRAGYHLIGKTYPGSLEHLNSARALPLRSNQS